VRTVILYLTLVINVIAMFSTIVGVLLHSGQGGGLSDMFGGGVTTNVSSSGVAERNLNRITIILGLVWVGSVIALGLFTRFGF
jgi:preprotein translocase subunit SecG